MTPSTSIGGADAPAVTPMVEARRSQSSRISDESSIITARHPARSATSTNRAVFEELPEPTTRIRSQRPAMARTASWRFWVA